MKAIVNEFSIILGVILLVGIIVFAVGGSILFIKELCEDNDTDWIAFTAYTLAIIAVAALVTWGWC